MEKLIGKLGIQDVLEETEEGYEYGFDDYNVFTDLYNKLEMVNYITKNSPQSYLNEEECHVEFDGEDFTVYLEGNFNIDDYRIIITED